MIEFLGQNSLAVTVGVVELVIFQRPKETRKPQSTQNQRHGNKVNQNVHFRANRKALRDTEMEEADIANAAASGVARPASATGTAIQL